MADSKLNILYLVDKNQYITKMSRVRFHAIDALSTISNLIFWGPGWRHYNSADSVDNNIKNMNLLIDAVIAYKPDTLIDFHKSRYLKIMTYNEMWDEPFTINEINFGRPDLVICHHENDMHVYKGRRFKELNSYARLFHIAHSAENKIFFNRHYDKPIDVLLSGAMGRHYPLRQRLRDIIQKMPKRFRCEEYKHPGYIHSDAFTDAYLKDYAENINKAKICISCTSSYKYRLGKMVEIPMCGSVLGCDIPGQNEDEFRDIMIVFEDDDTNQDIIDKLTFYLDHPAELEKIRQKGYEWAKKWHQERYGRDLLKQIEITLMHKKEIKIFVVADELISLKTKWICDVLKEEFIQYANVNIVHKSSDADIIWLLAPWSYRKVNRKDLETKFVISTIHHIDQDKYELDKNYYTLIDSLTNRYHCICPKTEESLRKITNKEIITTNFWINEDNFYKIADKIALKDRYNIPHNKFIVGSFQKDTEGSDPSLPKLSKGPDIFVKIVKDMKDNGKDIFVILTGWRRTYIISELDKIQVPYKYVELVDMKELNELYNTLDLYLVSSRVEGGPRAIIECGITETPLISTHVGISDLILHENSIYSDNDYMSYKKAFPDISHALKHAQLYSIQRGYMNTFVNKLFYELS
jgi:hypothetical protein